MTLATLIAMFVSLFSGLGQSSVAAVGSTAPLTYDVVVYGGGLSGVAAAIEASRHGSRVALVEETNCIGGQICAGVGSLDEGWRTFNTPSGIYREFVQRIDSHYAALGKKINTCYFGKNNRCVEPGVAQHILRAMLVENNIVVHEGYRPIEVLSTNKKVTGVSAEHLNGTSQTFLSKVLVDATEAGDIIRLSGAEFRVANGLSSQNSGPACIQDITYAAVIKKYPNGIPSTLRMDGPPPTAEAPEYLNYNHYVLDLRSHITATGTPKWLPHSTTTAISFGIHNAYRGLPDSSSSVNFTNDWFSSDPNAGDRVTKTSINLYNDFPVSKEFLLDPNVRKELSCQAKLRTLQFLYYVQNELHEDWSVSTDEGYDTAYTNAHLCDIIPDEYKEIERHLPPIPYIRESVRVVSLEPLLGKQVVSEIENFRIADPDAVALSDYPVDLHGCRSAETLESYLGETVAHQTHEWAPFGIPFEAFIPKEYDGLLPAEKNIDQTRYANGATRLHPGVTAIGQAAGLIAALAVEKNVEPRNVSKALVQKTLVEEGQAVSKHLFSDAPYTNQPLWRAVQLASLKGFMSPLQQGTFGVNQQMNRRDAAIVLSRLLDKTQPYTKTSFTDIASNNVGLSAIENLYQQNIISGCSTSPRKYCPWDPITREQAAIMLARILKLNTSVAIAQPPYYMDIQSRLAYPLIQAVSIAGLVPACNLEGKFCPTATMTRADMAQTITNAWSYKYK
jgi:hypothetical protein